MKRRQIEGGKKISGQTVVAEEKRRFMLLSSQRARLKSAITAAIRSAKNITWNRHLYCEKIRNREARGGE